MRGLKPAANKYNIRLALLILAMLPSSSKPLLAIDGLKILEKLAEPSELENEFSSSLCWNEGSLIMETLATAKALQHVRYVETRDPEDQSKVVAGLIRTGMGTQWMINHPLYSSTMDMAYNKGDV